MLYHGAAGCGPALVLVNFGCVDEAFIKAAAAGARRGEGPKEDVYM